MRVEVRPAFDAAVLAAEQPVRKAAARLVRLLVTLDVPGMWSHSGLNFENLHGMTDPLSGLQMYSLRVTGSARAITCLLSGPAIVLVSLHVQHDRAYRK